MLGWRLLHLLTTWKLCILHHSLYFNAFISPLDSSSVWGPTSSPAYAPGLWSTHVHTCELCMYTRPVNHSSRLCMCTVPTNHPCAPESHCRKALQTWEFSRGLCAQLLFTSTHLKSLCCLHWRKNESQLSNSLACQRAVSACAWLCFYIKKDLGSESPTFTS